MDKVERYVEYVCRGIAGPREMRRHIQQELREHLLDAIAEHEKAGMTHDAAVARALEAFGPAEQVRAEMETEHGQRLFTLVLEKALQWKENAMRAKWIQSACAHVMLGALILGEVAFVYAAMIFIYPSMKELMRDGWIATDSTAGRINAWGIHTLANVDAVCEQGAWIGLAVLALWLLFEWRVRRESKTPIRLALMAVGAVKMFIVVVVTSAAIVLPLAMLAHPRYHRELAMEMMRKATPRLEESVRELDRAAAEENWSEVYMRANRTVGALTTMWMSGAGEPLPWDAERENGAAGLQKAYRAAERVADAARRRDAAECQTALKAFHEAYAQLRPAAAQAVASGSPGDKLR